MSATVTEKSGLRFNPTKHHYTLDGISIPGVTTIIGRGLPKPGLPYWSARQVAEAAVDMADDMQWRVEHDGPQAVVDVLRRAPWRTRDKAGKRGTAVHEIAEKVVTGAVVTVPQHLAHRVQGLVDVLDELGIDPKLTEVKLYSRSEWYAGTADLIGVIDGETWLLDHKTSTSVHGSYALQCAAYARAEVFIDPTGAEHPMPHIDHIGVIHITEQGARLHRFPPIDEAFEAFLAVKRISDLTKTIDSWGSNDKH